MQSFPALMLATHFHFFCRNLFLIKIDCIRLHMLCLLMSVKEIFKSCGIAAKVANPKLFLDAMLSTEVLLQSFALAKSSLALLAFIFQSGVFGYFMMCKNLCLYTRKPTVFTIMQGGSNSFLKFMVFLFAF